jgi:hypothetical protein
MNKRTLAIMESVRAQRALTDTDNELRATIPDYDAKMAYHAHLMETMKPETTEEFKLVGAAMVAKFGE